MDDLKRKKADERSHRIVIKGRKVMEHHIINKNKKEIASMANTNKENNDYYMLFYDKYNYEEI